MENNKKITTKSIGLSYIEYQVILLSFGINNLMCFEKDTTEYDSYTQQELYNYGLARLYNRKLVTDEDGSLFFAQEIASAFSVISKCKKILVADKINENICCMYLGEDEFVVFEPGIREDEYLKFSVKAIDDITTYLEESLYINNSDAIDDICEKAPLLPVEGDGIVKLMEVESVNIDELRRCDEVSSILTISDRVKTENQSYIVIVNQPIQDKILLIDKEGNYTFQIYSRVMLDNLIRKIVGEKE